MPNQSIRLAMGAAPTNMKIIELENRCTGNRTVGSNPTDGPWRLTGVVFLHTTRPTGSSKGVTDVRSSPAVRRHQR